MTARTTVGDEMTHRAVTVRPEQDLYHAYATMRRCGFRHLPVVDGGGELVGILSERDLFRGGLVKNGVLAVSNKLVEEIMTKSVLTIGADRPAADAADLMIRNKIDALPVTDGAGRVLGIITSIDLLAALRRLTAS